MTYFDSPNKNIQALPRSCIHVDSTEPTVGRIEGIWNRWGARADQSIRNMFPQSYSAEVHKPFMTKCKDKLRALNIQQSVGKEFLIEIFGSRIYIANHFQMGLADAESEAAFNESLKTESEMEQLREELYFK